MQRQYPSAQSSLMLAPAPRNYLQIQCPEGPAPLAASNNHGATSLEHVGSGLGLGDVHANHHHEQQQQLQQHHHHHHHAQYQSSQLGSSRFLRIKLPVKTSHAMPSSNGSSALVSGGFAQVAGGGGGVAAGQSLHPESYDHRRVGSEGGGAVQGGSFDGSAASDLTPSMQTATHNNNNGMMHEEGSQSVERELELSRVIKELQRKNRELESKNGELEQENGELKQENSSLIYPPWSQADSPVPCFASYDDISEIFEDKGLMGRVHGGARVVDSINTAFKKLFAVVRTLERDNAEGAVNTIPEEKSRLQRRMKERREDTPARSMENDENKTQDLNYEERKQIVKRRYDEAIQSQDISSISKAIKEAKEYDIVTEIGEAFIELKVSMKVWPYDISRLKGAIKNACFLRIDSQEAEDILREALKWKEHKDKIESDFDEAIKNRNIPQSTTKAIEYSRLCEPNDDDISSLGDDGPFIAVAYFNLLLYKKRWLPGQSVYEAQLAKRQISTMQVVEKPCPGIDDGDAARDQSVGRLKTPRHMAEMDTRMADVQCTDKECSEAMQLLTQMQTEKIGTESEESSASNDDVTIDTRPSPFEDGLEYGDNSADIAADNMAAHIAANNLAAHTVASESKTKESEKCHHDWSSSHSESDVGDFSSDDSGVSSISSDGEATISLVSSVACFTMAFYVVFYKQRKINEKFLLSLNPVR